MSKLKTSAAVPSTTQVRADACRALAEEFRGSLSEGQLCDMAQAFVKLGDEMKKASISYRDVAATIDLIQRSPAWELPRVTVSLKEHVRLLRRKGE